MGNYNTFARIWWIVDTWCIRKRFRYYNPEFMFSRFHFIGVNKCWIVTKGKDILMVKIGQLSMSAAFDPPQSSLESSKSTLDVIEEYFYGDWRKGKEIQKVVITQRLYQISSNSTQAWFSNSKFEIKRAGIQTLKFSWAGAMPVFLRRYRQKL